MTLAEQCISLKTRRKTEFKHDHLWLSGGCGFKLYGNRRLSESAGNHVPADNVFILLLLCVFEHGFPGSFGERGTRENVLRRSSVSVCLKITFHHNLSVIIVIVERAAETKNEIRKVLILNGVIGSRGYNVRFAS